MKIFSYAAWLNVVCINLSFIIYFFSVEILSLLLKLCNDKWNLINFWSWRGLLMASWFISLLYFLRGLRNNNDDNYYNHFSHVSLNNLNSFFEVEGFISLLITFGERSFANAPDKLLSCPYRDAQDANNDEEEERHRKLLF